MRSWCALNVVVFSEITHCVRCLHAAVLSGHAEESSGKINNNHSPPYTLFAHSNLSISPSKPLIRETRAETDPFLYLLSQACSLTPKREYPHSFHHFRTGRRPTGAIAPEDPRGRIGTRSQIFSQPSSIRQRQRSDPSAETEDKAGQEKEESSKHRGSRAV